MSANPPAAIAEAISAGKVMLAEARKSPTDFAWTLIYRLRQAGITDAELLEVSNRINEREELLRAEHGFEKIRKLGQQLKALKASRQIRRAS